MQNRAAQFVNRSERIRFGNDAGATKMITDITNVTALNVLALITSGDGFGRISGKW